MLIKQLSLYFGIGLSIGGIKLPGRCPKVDPMMSKKFNLERYVGRWYNIANLPFFFQEEGATCGTADYKLNQDLSKFGVPYVDVKNAELRQKLLGPKWSASEGTAIQTDQDGALAVSFFGKPKKSKANYLVLDTDYENLSKERFYFLFLLYFFF